VPVHHMEAHALMAGMPGVMQQQQQQQQDGQTQQQQPPQMTFPALLLLVSGCHNMLVRAAGVLSC
jgi:tRNA A37 threonylcarbamoyltransferase TsaD